MDRGVSDDFSKTMLLSQKEGNSLVCINTKIIIPYQKHKNTVFIIDSRNCIINQQSKAVTSVMKLRVKQWAFGILKR